MRAWQSGNYSKIMAEHPWNELHYHLEDTLDAIGNTHKGAGQLAFEHLPAPVKNEFRYDVENPAYRKTIQNTTGRLIIGLQQEQNQNIQQIVSRSFTQALSPKRAADQIKNSIGLLPRQEMALMNFQNGLYAQGVKDSKVEEMTDRYADRMLDSRALTIARTEIRTVSNEGQLAVWQEADNQGYLPEGSQKVWVTDGKPCDICEPMDGIAVDLDDSWELDDGTMVFCPPMDVHPNCECGMELSMGGDE